MKKNLFFNIVISAIAGILIFVLVFGVRVINPTYIDWLLGETDSFQHYIGWQFYRKSEWQPIVGMFDKISYPNSISIVFLDSIPLVAVPLKIFSDFLPVRFQYFGMWAVFSFALQSIFGMLITRKYTGDGISAVIGGMLFTLTPVMINRTLWHTSLVSHWLILISITLYVYIENMRIKKTQLLIWFLLGILIAGVHLYFYPICLFFCFMYVLKLFFITDKQKILALLNPIGLSAGVIINLFFLGGFLSEAHFGSTDVRKCGVNLLCLINSRGTSDFIPEIEIYRDYVGGEGYAYLGLGVICLLITAVVISVKEIIAKRKNKCLFEIKKLFLLWSAAYILVFVISMSPEIAVGNKLIVDYSIPTSVERVWHIFRATGRFIWIDIYMLLTFGIKCLSRRINGDRKMVLKFKEKTVGLRVRTLALVFFVFFIIQLLDLRSWIETLNSNYANEVCYQSSLENALWEKVADKAEHVIIPEYLETCSDIAEWAYEHNLTLNRYYYAREIDSVKMTMEEELKNPSDDEVFIVRENDDVLKQVKNGLYSYHADGFIVLSKSKLI